MKTILLISLTLLSIGTLLNGCAISHKRGSDANESLAYYLANRGTISEEVTKMVSLKNLKEADVTIQWSVDEKGATKDVTITHDTLHNDKVNQRLVEHLKSLKFPKTPRFTTTTVEYTYKFQAAQSE
jgi:hypothetical protein